MSVRCSGSNKKYSSLELAEAESEQEMALFRRFFNTGSRVFLQVAGGCCFGCLPSAHSGAVS